MWWMFLLAACSEGPKEGEVEMAVAVADLPPGHVITADDIKKVWTHPDYAMQGSGVGELVGQTLPEGILQGEVFTWARLHGGSAAPKMKGSRVVLIDEVKLGVQGGDVLDAWKVAGDTRAAGGVWRFGEGCVGRHEG